jgi:acetyl-CoA C-acetyltransferase
MPGEIVIVSAARTAVGSFNGAFAATPAHELGAAAIKGALVRAEVDAGEVDEVILGQVLTANQGQNPARQAAIKAGIPQDKTAFGLNQVCGSGLRAVALGMQQIANGDAKIVVAGGQESMSLSQHGAHLRAGTKMGDLKFVDTMIRDGLTDVFNGYHMGQTAENVAAKWQLSRHGRTNSRWLRKTRPRRRKRRAGSRKRLSPSPSAAGRATSWSMRTNISGRARRSTRSPS